MNSETSKEPKPPFGPIFLLVLVLGIAVLLAWNAYGPTILFSMSLLLAFAAVCLWVFSYSDSVVIIYKPLTPFVKSYSVAMILGLFLITIAAIVWGYGFLYEHTPGCWTLDKRGNPPDADSVVPNHFYFSVVTISTLGYGDLTPVGECRKLAMSQTLTGFLGLPLLAGLILHALTRKPGE